MASTNEGGPPSRFAPSASPLVLPHAAAGTSPSTASESMPMRVLVVGAGPGGLAAALAAEAGGAVVTLVDALPEPGGQIWRSLWHKPASGQAGGCFQALRASAITLKMSHRVITAPAPGCLGVIGPEGPKILSYDRLILATGARELFLPFPGWTLPGVLGAGGLQALVKGGLDVKGKRVVVAGSGPLLLAAASHFRTAGAQVLAVAEQAPNSALLPLLPGMVMRPRLILQALPFLSLPLRPKAWVTRAEGDGRLQRLHLRTSRGTRVLEADLLACAFGLVPNLDLVQLLGCELRHGCVAVDDAQRTSLANVFAVGESTGIGGMEKALAEGRVAGSMAVGREVEARRHQAAAARGRAWARALEASYALRPELRSLPEAGTIVCRCEDVTAGALQAHACGRDARLQSRCGMGRCQGRTCGPATEFLFGWAPGGPRQPLVPTPFAELVGALSQPEQP